MSDTTISNPEFKIDLKNPEKTFTNKQLWDAFVNAQTKLDEAVGLLKKTLEHFEDPYTDPNPRIEIDTFLKGVEG